MSRHSLRLVVFALVAGWFAGHAAAPGRSKLGLHLLSSYTAGAAAVDAAHPRVVKILGTDSTMLRAAREYKTGTPQGLVVLRVYTTLRWTLADNPALAGSNFWSRVLAPALSPLSAADRALINYVEGPNEADSTPAWGSLAEAKWFNEFWVVLGRLIRDNGFRPCSFSIPVGNPGGSDAEVKQALAAIVPALRVCFNTGGAWSYHAYTTAYSQDPGVEYWYSLRYRQYYAYFANSYPDLSDLPLLLTEGGVDNGHGWNWPANGNAARYQTWLAWFDQQIRQDAPVLGVTLFQSGDTGAQWQSWETEPITPWLKTNLLNQPLTSPMLALSPGLLEVVATVGTAPAQATFTIRNVGSGSGGYTMTTTAAWMNVTPTFGTVSTQANQATVTCTVGSLAPGSYYGVIKVKCSSASPVLQTIPVRLTVVPRLAISPHGAALWLQWTGAVRSLESAAGVAGPWQRTVNPISPYVVTPSAAQACFRFGP